MKQMTTAEFSKAALQALAEPVEVRRYKEIIGVYYPAGYEPVTALAMGAQPEVVPLADIKRFDEMEEEIARLKKELAARPAKVPPLEEQLAGARRVIDAVSTRTVPVPARTDDPFVGLGKQDKEFFDRKMGKKK